MSKGLLLPIVATLAVDTDVELNNGITMPLMAFAAQVWSADTCKDATSKALQAGFRNIWSSVLVGNGCQIAQGEAIAASGIPLSELFIAGTVNTGGCSGTDACYEQTKSDAEGQYVALGVDKLDMLMLDYPTYDGCDGIRGQWKAFEEIYAAGRVRTIAVSNFNDDDMNCVVDTNGTVPSVNMLRFNVDYHGSEVADNAKFGTVVQSYSPLGSGSLVFDDLCASIGQPYNKSAAQIALKWILQTGVAVATQSTSLSHLIEDIELFDFTLTDDEMSQLDNKISVV